MSKCVVFPHESTPYAHTISHCSCLCQKNILAESEGFMFCAPSASSHKLNKMKRGHLFIELTSSPFCPD